MASFSAELHVAGQSFPVTHCFFGVEQATHQRGRVSTKVRYGPVELVLSVPDGDTLFGWANAPTKRLAAQVFFRDGDGGSVLETLSLQAAYCVAYHEQFVGGDAAGGAYQCQLTLSDPDGWTLAAGGPASAFVAPAARAHGLPGAVAAGVVSALQNVAIGGGPGGGRPATETSAPITVSRDFVGEVAMEHSDLGRMALAFRKAKPEDNWHDGNVTVFEYMDEAGDLRHLVQETQPEITSKHAERLALEKLQKERVPPENIRRIYSELEPCETPDGGKYGDGCKAMLRNEVPNAKITYSYEYRGSKSDTRPARLASIARRKTDFKKFQL